MHPFFLLRTKPRLSQAGALLLPKDFVSLGIKFHYDKDTFFVLTIPTKPFFSSKELARDIAENDPVRMVDTYS